MARALLSLAGLFGGVAVFLAGLNAGDTLDALRAIAAGVRLLLVVMALGLGDLIDIAQQTTPRERPPGRADEGRPPAR
jgi:hypothetical protein